MPIVVQCDECGKKYKVRDDLDGTEIPCKECGAGIWVEDDDGPPRRSGRQRGNRRGGARSAPRSRGRKKQASNPKTALWIAGGVGGLVVVVVAIVLVVMLGGDDDDSENAVASNSSALGGQNAQPAAGNNPGARPPVIPPFNPAGNNDGEINNGNRAGTQPPPFVPPANNNAAAPANGQGAGGFANPPQQLPGRQPGGGGLQPGAPLNIQDISKPEVWKVAADPPKTQFEITKQGDFSIKLPDAFASSSILFPSTYSPIVSLGDNGFDKSVREIWNFAEGKKLATLGGVKLMGSKFAVSPDGKFLAAILHGNSKGPRIIDMEESKDLGELQMAERVSFVKLMEFASPTRLLAAQMNDSTKVWSLPDGKLEREITFPEGFEDKSITFSPGGRYLALTETRNNKLYLIDLDAGDHAGIAPLPTSSEGSLRCQTLRFSPDGTELAGLFEAGRGSRVVIWKMADGEVSEQIVFADRIWASIPSAYGYNGPKIEWFPNGQRFLLFGMLVLDRATKKVIWTIPETDRSPRHVLDDGRILAGMDVNGKKVLTTYKLPEEEIAAAQKVLEQGGTLEDAGLPDLTLANREGMKQLERDGAGADWKVPLDPAPQPEQPLLEGDMSLRSSTGKVQSLLLSRADGHRAVLMYSSGAARNQDGAEVWLEAYDVATKEHSKTFKLPFASELLAVSPKGDQVIMRLAGSGERLDCWKIEDGEHVVGWRPYLKPDDENGGVQAVKRPNSETDQTVTAAAYLDDSHLLTLNRKNELVMWQLPECRAVYSIADAGKPGISPGGKVLVISNGKNFRFFNALTGDVVGDLALPGTLASAAFHPDGKKFAVVVTDAQGNRLVSWDLSTGQVADEFPIPASAQWMQWVGDNYILFDQGLLIDIENKLAAWKYQLANGVRSPLSPNEQVWYLASGSRGGDVSLVSVKVPEQSVQDYLQKNKDTIEADYVIKPGDTISVMINLRDPPGEPNFRARLYKAVVDRYAQNNIKVATKQSVTVAFFMEHSNTGETEEWRMLGGFRRNGPSSGTVQIEKVVNRITITRDGQTISDSRIPHTNSPGFMMRIPPDKGVAEHLTEQMWKRAASSLLGFNASAYVFGPKAAEGLGRSAFTPSGISTIGQ